MHQELLPWYCHPFTWLISPSQLQSSWNCRFNRHLTPVVPGRPPWRETRLLAKLQGLRWDWWTSRATSSSTRTFRVVPGWTLVCGSPAAWPSSKRSTWRSVAWGKWKVMGCVCVQCCFLLSLLWPSTWLWGVYFNSMHLSATLCVHALIRTVIFFFFQKACSTAKACVNKQHYQNETNKRHFKFAVYVYLWVLSSDTPHEG